MAYAALLFYVVILFVRPQEWVHALYGMRLQQFTIGVALATWLGSLATSKWRLKAVPQNMLMLGLFAAALMSHVRHTYFSATISTFQEFGKIVLVFFLVSSLVTSLPKAKGLILVMALGALFMAADGITEWHTGVGFTGVTPVIYHGQVRVRSSGIFHDPNDLSLMLVTILPFLMTYTWRRGHSMPIRALSGAACVPLALCIFYTNSRGGWLALGTMLMMYVAIHMRRRKLGVIFALVVFLIVFSLGPSRLSALSTSEGSAHGRIMPGAPPTRCSRATRSSVSAGACLLTTRKTAWWPTTPLRTAGGSWGMVGYFFWLGLVIASSKDCWALSTLKVDDLETEENVEKAQYEQLGKATLAAFAGFMAAAMFLSRTYVVPLDVLFGLVAGLRTSYESVHGPLEHGFQKHDLRYVALAAVVSVPMLWLFIRISG